jgi:hypothetical protein
MTYRVILTCNGVYKKTLHRCKTRDTAFINFHRIKEANNVIYPKRFINTYGIRPVKYEICVTKPTEDTDTFRILRDDYGKTYEEPQLGDWTILHSDDYDIEETFWVYGLPSKGPERPTIHEIIRRLMINAHAKKCVKQVIVVYNKLLIYNEDQFDMVICKNLEEAQRLHHTLAKIARKQKIKSLMFMGTASQATTSKMYDLIHEETQWPYIKIRRTSTRP